MKIDQSRMKGLKMITTDSIVNDLEKCIERYNKQKFETKHVDVTFLINKCKKSKKINVYEEYLKAHGCIPKSNPKAKPKPENLIVAMDKCRLIVNTMKELDELFEEEPGLREIVTGICLSV